jgi:hypothetical protein
VAEALFGGSVAVAVEDAEEGGRSVGEADGDFGAAFEVVGGGDGPGRAGWAEGSGVGRMGAAEGEEGVVEAADVAVEGRGEDLERPGEGPGTDGMAGFGKGAGAGVGTGGEEGHGGKVFDGPRAEVAEPVAFSMEKGVAEDEPSAGGDDAGGRGEDVSAGGGREFVEDVVEGDDVGGCGREGGVGGVEGRRVGAEGRRRPTGGAEGGEDVAEESEGGTRVVLGGGADCRWRDVCGPSAGEPIEEGEEVAASTGPQREETEGRREGGGREEGEREGLEDLGGAGVGLGGEVEGVGEGFAGGAEVGGGGGGRGGAGGGEAVGQTSDVGKQPVEGVAVGGGAGLGPGHVEPDLLQDGREGDGRGRGENIGGVAVHGSIRWRSSTCFVQGMMWSSQRCSARAGGRSG